MNYITVKEAATKWNVSTRRVQILCSQDRIKGAYRFGKVVDDSGYGNIAKRKTKGRTKPSYAEKISFSQYDRRLHDGRYGGRMY